MAHASLGPANRRPIRRYFRTSANRRPPPLLKESLEHLSPQTFIAQYNKRELRAPDNRSTEKGWRERRRTQYNTITTDEIRIRTYMRLELELVALIVG